MLNNRPSTPFPEDDNDDLECHEFGVGVITLPTAPVFIRNADLFHSVNPQFKPLPIIKRQQQASTAMVVLSLRETGEKFTGTHDEYQSAIALELRSTQEGSKIDLNNVKQHMLAKRKSDDKKPQVVESSSSSAFKRLRK